MFFQKNQIVFLFIVVLISTISCVGTIEDSNPPLESSKEQVIDSQLEFDGIISASAIAHDKVEVTFKAATGGSGSFAYVVYLNGNFQTPHYSVSASSIETNAQGYYTIIVTGLSKGKKYSFSVRVFDEKNKVYDTNGEQAKATTLSSEVPNFAGLQKIENLAGVFGLSQLKLIWVQATPSVVNTSNYFGTDPHAVSGYNIYLGTSELDMALVGSVTGKDQTEYILTNLEEATTYYVKVRAKNSMTPPVEETNNLIKSLATLSPMPITFSGVKSAATPTTSAGFYQASLSWDAGTGNFDRYKIFLSTDPVSSFDPKTDTPKLSNVSLTNTSVTLNLDSPNQTYYVAVVACLNDDCLDYKGHNVVKSFTTTPPVASFDGIQSITSPSGVDALTIVYLNWNSPDTQTGVFDTIKVFKTSADGTYNESSNFIPPCPNGGAICYENLQANSITIKQLITGQEACFVAKAYSVSPPHPNYPNGRTHSNENRKCTIPQYQIPGFLGPSIGCQNATTSGFKISWNHPTAPVGIYDQYEVFYKAGSNNFDYSVATTAIYDQPGGCSIQGYCKVIVNSSQSSATLTSLAPNTNYQVGVRTYFYDGSNGIYDSNQVLNNCLTENIKIDHSGWRHLISIGPKTNGLQSGITIRERLLLPEEDYYGGAVANNKMFIPLEDPTGDSDSSSIDGIVYLAWDDFKVNGLANYLNDFSSYGVGYNIYRAEHTAAFDTAAPLPISSVWGSKLNSTPIPITSRFLTNSGTAINIGEFVDYTLEHPLNDGGDANEGKIYWYLVKGVINGQEIDFYDNSVLDNVIRVVLPPANQLFGHRWIMNRNKCDFLKKSIDRTQHYRCSYNGLGTKGGYHDYQDHFIADRFGLGIKMTRGGDPLACSDGGAGYNRTPSFQWAGANTGNGFLAGDCMGAAKASVPLIAAPKGAVYFDLYAGAYTSRTYINTCPTGPACTTWTDLSALYSDADTNNNNPFLDSGDLDCDSTCKGYHQVFSNEAYLPPMTNISTKAANWVCLSKKIDLNGTTYRGAMTSNRQHKALNTGQIFMPFSDYNDIFYGTKIFNSSTSGMPVAGDIDTDCHTYVKKNSSHPTAFPGLYASQIPMDSLSFAQFFLTGSSGPISTEACVSGFGMQDPIGNASIVASDVHWAADWGYSLVYSDSSLSTAIPASYLINPDQSGDWKNINGRSYSGVGSNEIGYVHTNANTAPSSYICPSLSASTYLNPILGTCIRGGKGHADDDLSHLSFDKSPFGITQGKNFITVSHAGTYDIDNLVLGLNARADNYRINNLNPMNFFTWNSQESNASMNFSPNGEVAFHQIRCVTTIPSSSTKH